MKISTKRRLYSLLLAFIMVLTLAPTALLGEEGDNQPEPTPGRLEELRLSSDFFTAEHDADSDYGIILEPRTNADRGSARITVNLDPSDDDQVQGLHVEWLSKDSSVVTAQEQSNGHIGTIFGEAAGKTYVEVSAGNPGNRITKTIEAVVSGIKLSSKLESEGISVKENQTAVVTLSTSGTSDDSYTLFGNAEKSASSMTATVVPESAKRNIEIVSVSNGTVTIRGVEAGSGRVRLTIPSAGGNYLKEFAVTVTSGEDEGRIEWTGGCSPAKPLKFSMLESLISEKCKEILGQDLASVTGLTVSTSQGTLYLGYNSPEDPGAGVGGSITYYPRQAARGPYIQDITFVPNASFAGEKAIITFTGQSSSGKSFKGRIEVTLTQEKTDLTVSTNRETPLQLTASMFSRACQEQTGSPLSYVIFTLPPASQGTLYTDYKSEWDYAAKVSSSERYNQSKINKITFVPAQGFVGTVTVSYAGYSVSGAKYNGQLVIQVKQGLDDAITYNDNGAGLVTFFRADFDAFCENATGRLISSVAFTQLPSSQGKLYLNWNGIRGTEVTEGTDYSYAQIDRLTFVAANGFNGVVRIPFSGKDRAGETFKGTVEIHIKSADIGNGDINYICAPGQSVKLAVSDFANLCQTLTGQKLYYISFQTLPDHNMGALYHNRTSSGNMGTRVTTAAKYFNSAVPYISNLSFWATDNFRGGVEIPFTGAAVTGETFTGTLYISSGEGAGSGTAGAVRYTVTGGSNVTFSGADFDTACRQATNAALDRIRFDLPSSGQGILYYDYFTNNTPKAHDPSTVLYRTGQVSVDKVTFVPASSFSGIAYVPFTAWSINGTEYRGNVEITVRSASSLGGLIRYETTGAPVRFAASDVLAAFGSQPASLRITGLPSNDQGVLYYGYESPTQYSWVGNTTTEYHMNVDPTVSNLTFGPRAGYTGTVEIPYTAVDTDGVSSTGTFRITVREPYSSAHFSDLSGYSAQYLSAIDYLYSMNVTNGVGGGKFDPSASIKRGDFCLMLSRAFQFNVGSTSQGFRDVPSTAYYAQAVNQMYAIGVVNGTGGGRFEPSASITRQDAALMVQRALQQAGISAPDGNAAALASYSDRSQVASYAQGAVGGLAQLGIFPVASRGTLSPKTNLTRADMALLLHRAMTTQ